MTLQNHYEQEEGHEIPALSVAEQILRAGIGHMHDRAGTYDSPGGERSIPSVVEAFAAITGIVLTEEQGCLFMVLLKAVRSQQGDFKRDSYEDGATYFGLMGEAGEHERKGDEGPSPLSLDLESVKVECTNTAEAVSKVKPGGDAQAPGLSYV